MANTDTQIHIHTVFSVRGRNCVIRKDWKDELYRYMTGIIQHHNHKVLAINGMPDHVHVFFGMRPVESLSELMQHVKSDSSAWINEKGFTNKRFSWQGGYGAFSYSKSQVNNVIDYIKNQEIHHHKKTFIEEYHDFLEKFEIDFDEQYIFNPVDWKDE